MHIASYIIYYIGLALLCTCRRHALKGDMYIWLVNLNAALSIIQLLARANNGQESIKLIHTALH